MTKTLTVTIPPSGLISGKSQIKVEAAGFEGDSCRDVTSTLQKALGHTTEEVMTHEHTEQPMEERLSDN